MSLQEKKDKFILVAKRILKKDLSTNKETLAAYKRELISVYNENIHYIQKNFDRVKARETYLEYIPYIRGKFSKCLTNLQLTYTFKEDIFEIVDENQIEAVQKQTEFTYQSEDEDFRLNDLFIGSESDPNTNSTIDKMAEEKQKFIATYSKLIPEFDGEIEKLPGFIDACELMEEAVGTHMETAVKIIKTKLGITTRSRITNEKTIEEVIKTLEKTPRGESSKVINSRLMSLKQGNRTANDFIQEIEKVTNQLRVSYLIEGMPSDLAESQSVEGAVRSLITNVSNARVKTVLQAADLKTINDVSTKFLSVSTGQAGNNAQIFYNKRFNRFNKRGSYSRGRGNRYYGNYGNNNYGNNSRGYYQGNGSYRGNRGRGNFRGRGNYRGQSNQSQSIRYTENYQLPQLANRARLEIKLK